MTVSLAHSAAISHGTGQIEPFAVVERRVIEEAIAAFDGNVALAATVLDLAPSTFYRKRPAWQKAGGGHFMWWPDQSGSRLGSGFSASGVLAQDFQPPQKLGHGIMRQMADFAGQQIGQFCRLGAEATRIYGDLGLGEFGQTLQLFRIIPDDIEIGDDALDKRPCRLASPAIFQRRKIGGADTDGLGHIGERHAAFRAQLPQATAEWRHLSASLLPMRSSLGFTGTRSSKAGPWGTSREGRG